MKQVKKKKNLTKYKIYYINIIYLIIAHILQRR